MAVGLETLINCKRRSKESWFKRSCHLCVQKSKIFNDLKLPTYLHNKYTSRLLLHILSSYLHLIIAQWDKINGFLNLFSSLNGFFAFVFSKQTKTLVCMIKLLENIWVACQKCIGYISILIFKKIKIFFYSK